MSRFAYIGVGSNLGKKRDNCETAVDKISSLADVKLIAVSKWREYNAITSHPGEEQPAYINGAIKISTPLTPDDLFLRLKDIEHIMGRPKKYQKWSPRTIDLDILLYNNIVREIDSLRIPHPEIHKRVFVLEPLCDIEPRLIHPVIGRTIEQLLKEMR